MAGELLEAIQRLQISVNSDGQWNDGSIDALFTQSRPRKRTRKTPEAIKKELEEEFLRPPTTFSAEWLNRLQQ